MNDTQDASSSVAVTCAACDTCEDPDQPMMRCGGCKLSLYCSKECQKMHWPIHKLSCIKTKFSLKKLVSSFTGNSYISANIEIAAAAAFGFDKTDPVAATPYVVQCHLWMTPKIPYASGILTRPKSDPKSKSKSTSKSTLLPREVELEEGTEGMLLLRSFEAMAHPETSPNWAKYAQWRIVDPEHVRSVYSDHTPVFVDFYVNGGEECVNVTFYVKNSLWQAMREDSMNELWEGSESMVFINRYVRQDVRNVLLLRTFMTKEDVDAFERLVEMDEFLNEEDFVRYEEPFDKDRFSEEEETFEDV
ncbi:hypothetical protein BDN70DRAFT_881588 [Pholiota conissans]|uniref:MYND-type domain-containing protein n=1 Tax=Pholiota conissans TaxID=109636 RepID=A0A9P6CSB2_9AGAR|nr:hypothetical protein BDN70DRAFT_881588 [Pholiota conissans]